MEPVSPKKNNGRLARALKGEVSPLKPLRCALSENCHRCQRRGYLIGRSGAYAHAELCSCVAGCPACLGGRLRIDRDTASACRAPSPQQVVASLNQSRIPARYAAAQISLFRNFSGNGAKVVNKLTRWLRGFDPRSSGDAGKGLLMTGPVGVGKTFLLASLAKSLVERGYTVRFTDFFQLLGDLRSGFSEGKADAAQLAPLIEVDVLLIDELGKGRGKDFDRAVLDQLVTGRYNQNKTIVATTNYQLNSYGAQHNYNVALDAAGQDFSDQAFGALSSRVGPRIFSRLREMTTFLELTGEDVRTHG